MPSDVNANIDPVLVFGMVGLLVGALILGLIFARPRRGFGAATNAEAAGTPSGEAWMPGGDIFEGDQPGPPAPLEPAIEVPPIDERPIYPPPPQHDPWSTIAPDQAGQQPRWDR